MKIARHLWLGLGGLSLATLSCQIILGLEEPTGAPVTEAPPAPGEAGSDGGDPCPHSLRPPPPAKDDNPDLKNTYWFAARSVTAPIDQKAGPKGYDLDNACTCKADLHDGGPSCNAASVVCDLDRGIDDSLGAALGEFSRFPTAADAIKPVNANLQKGSRSLLVYVSEYNGLANDKSVSVAFVNAGGLYTRMGCGDSGAERPLVETYAAIPGDSHTPPGKARYAPAYDGCDRWSPEVGSFGTAGRFPSYQSSAYVTDFQLVVSVDKVTTAIFGTRPRSRTRSSSRRSLRTATTSSSRASWLVACRSTISSRRSAAPRPATGSRTPAIPPRASKITGRSSCPGSAPRETSWRHRARTSSGATATR